MITTENNASALFFGRGFSCHCILLFAHGLRKGRLRVRILIVVERAISIINDGIHVKILDAKIYIIECVMRRIHPLKLITCIGLLNLNASIAQRSLLVIEDFVYSSAALVQRLLLVSLLLRLLHLLFTHLSGLISPL